MTNSAPHLRAAETVSSLQWKRLAALVPLVVVELIFFHLPAVRVLAIALAVAAVTMSLRGAFVATKAGAPAPALNRNPLTVPSFSDGTKQSALLGTGLKHKKTRPVPENDAIASPPAEARNDVLGIIFTTLLFSFLLPMNLSWWIIVVGITIVLITRQIFGSNSYFLSPVLVGHAFLQLSFPEKINLFSPGLFYASLPEIGKWLLVAALLAGGVILIWQKLIAWELPFIYLALIFFLAKIFPWPGGISLPWLLLTALFLITDPVTAPLTRRGRYGSAATAAIFTWLLHQVSGAPVPEVFAVLLTNLLTPWFDQWILPKRIKGDRSRPVPFYETQ